VDLGFSADDVIAMEMRLLDPKYYPDERRAAFQENVMARIREIPGVAQASMATAVPMRGVDWSYVIGPKGGPSKGGHMRAVDADYFTIMGIALKSGRLFTSADSQFDPRVTIVSESFGRSLFGSVSPLGKTLSLGREDIEIIGVVEDVRYVSAASEPEPAFYFPRSQEPSELMCLLIKPQPGARDAVINSVRSAIVAVDPGQPVEGITTIDKIVEESTADSRFYAASTAAFASLALIIAIAGVFGVASRLVSEQQREFAIRIALGAENVHLLRLVIGSGMAPVIAGAAAGLLVAYSGSRALQRFMFGVAPTDALAYVSAAVLLIVVAAAACLAPAVRATRIQPMAVLKQE
jgi:predicted permease